MSCKREMRRKMKEKIEKEEDLVFKLKADVFGDGINRKAKKSIRDTVNLK